MGLLEVLEVTKYYGDFKALDNVDLKINRDERISIIGPNGAGKTTLLNLISGLLKPTRGKIILEGKNITNMSPSERCKLGIVKSFQIPSYFPNLTTLDNLKVALISSLGKSKNFLKSYQQDEEINNLSERALEVFGLYERRNFLAKDLPHGDKKLLDVASAFALRPKLILLDEPTSGVSIKEKRDLMGTIMSALKEMEISSLILVEHDMDIVFNYSSRVVVLHNGKILDDSSPELVKANKEVASVMFGS
ncbi:MAG: ABC transporter ATP-binding protein [Nitrososphaerales archaeon]